MIETRYTLGTVIDTAIGYRLSKDELFSALMSECDFKNTSNIEYTLGVLICRLYLFNLKLTQSKQQVKE